MYVRCNLYCAHLLVTQYNFRLSFVENFSRMETMLPVPVRKILYKKAKILQGIHL